MCRRCATKIHGRQKLCKRHSHRQELRICVSGSFTVAIIDFDTELTNVECKGVSDFSAFSKSLFTVSQPQNEIICVKVPKDI